VHFAKGRTDKKLVGKIVIVTGGGRDIGRAVAINYSSSSKGAEEAVAAIEAIGGKAITVQGDLNDKADVDALVSRAVETFGSIDILVNNAGGLIARKTIAEMPVEHWEAVMSLNLTSTFLMTQACLSKMASGAIVNLASQAGRERATLPLSRRSARFDEPRQKTRRIAPGPRPASGLKRRPSHP
jgi:3-oxoacyl-[acyl-carrier protein] reductase